jgi:CRP/FNR family transcriptional regulator, cyclic AMP receptor protein
MRQLMVGARSIDYGQGEIVLRVGDAEGPALISTGLLRAFVTSDKGREAVIAYLGPGQLIGLTTLFDQMPITVAAVEKSNVIRLDPALISRVAHEHSDFAWSLLRHNSVHATYLAAAVRNFAFKTVKQRVAARLLDFMAQMDGGHTQMIVRVTQQELADSVGSVREVVARALRDLRLDGLVAVSATGIVIVDEPGLRHLHEDDGFQ